MCHNYGMSVRTTVDLPDDVYRDLRLRAAAQQTSIRSLIVEAIESRYRPRKHRKPMTGPPLPGKSKPGPACPDKENPYDFMFA
jgi:hypothetical protein